MKVILSYGNYLNYGKQYQAKFIYENIEEIKTISNHIQNYSYNTEFKVSEGKYIDRKHNKTIDTIGAISIPKESLLQFISDLITSCNAKVIIGNQEITTFDLNKIEDAIDKLHINITLRKGKYFGFKDCYFVTFKYASDEQRTEVSYDFNINLNSLIGKNIDTDGEDYIYPFAVDKTGKITGANTNIIGGTNIPNHTLAFFLTRFIHGYNAVLTIGDEKLKETMDSTKLLVALSSLEPGKQKVRKQK